MAIGCTSAITGRWRTTSAPRHAPAVDHGVAGLENDFGHDRLSGEFTRTWLIRPTLQDDLERGRLGGVSEGVVGLHDVVETESMRDESCGTQLARLHQFEQQWRRDCVDQTRREHDVAVPQFLEVQLHGLAMDADI